MDTSNIPAAKPMVPKLTPEEVQSYLDGLGVPPQHLMKQHAFNLGISLDDMDYFGVKYDGDAAVLVFPLRDAKGQLTGCRMRRRDGRKWSLKGSSDGLIIGKRLDPREPLIVTEGVTDPLGARHAGFWNIVSRSNCSLGGDHIKALMRSNPATPVLILSDPDAVGLDGSKALAFSLPNPTLVFVGPEDVRRYVSMKRTNLFKTVVGLLNGGAGDWRVCYRNMHATSVPAERIIARLR